MIQPWDCDLWYESDEIKQYDEGPSAAEPQPKLGKPGFTTEAQSIPR